MKTIYLLYFYHFLNHFLHKCRIVGPSPDSAINNENNSNNHANWDISEAEHQESLNLSNFHSHKSTEGTEALNE